MLTNKITYKEKIVLELSRIHSSISSLVSTISFLDATKNDKLVSPSDELKESIREGYLEDQVELLKKQNQTLKISLFISLGSTISVVILGVIDLYLRIKLGK